VIILCCHSGLRPETRAALEKHAPGTVFTDVSGSPLDQWRAISQWWDGTGPVVHVDHDQVIHATVIPQFEGCASDWCSFRTPYNARGTLAETGTACVKYSARLQQLIPRDLVAAQRLCPDRCGQCGPECKTGVCWHHLDAVLVYLMQRAGIEGPCLHYPVVAHRHLRYPTFLEMRPRMSSVKWQMGTGLVMYVLDITAGGGAAQMFLGTEWPQDDDSSLTAADTATLASGVATAVSAVSGVTGCTSTVLAVNEPASGVLAPRWGLEFDSAIWTSWTLGLTIRDGYAGFTNAYLYATSPVDGLISHADMDSVISGLVTACEAFRDVTACTAVQNIVTPSTA
jgi:hypothetical protein